MAGMLAHGPKAMDITRRDVPRCGPNELLRDVRVRVVRAGWDRAVVVDDLDVVLGLVSGEAFQRDADAPIELVMEPGPRTIRPSVPLENLGDHVSDDERMILVTTADGALLGVLDRADAELRLRQTAA
jgi:CBS domain-containing protein